MQSASLAFKNALNEDSRTFKIRLIDYNTDEEIVCDVISMIHTSASNASEETVMIGSAVSTYVEIQLYSEYEFASIDMLVDIGIDTSTEILWHTMGKFTVVEVSESNKIKTITAYDNLYINNYNDYLAGHDLTYPATIDELINYTGLSAYVGLNIDEDKQEYLDYTITNPISTDSVRDTVSQIASLLGGFAYFNHSNYCEITSFCKGETIEINADNYYSLNVSDKSITIDYIVCGNYSAGDAYNYTFKIIIDNDSMTEELFNDISSDILNMPSFNVGTIEIKGNPLIDVTDMIQVTDVNNNVINIPCMKVEHHFDGGLISKIYSYGKSEIESRIDYNGPNQKLLKKIKEHSKMLAEMQTLIDNIDVSNAIAVLLSNEFHAVPTDSTGNNGNYTGCDTTVQVMFGEEDITDLCTFTFTNQNIVGTWNTSTYKYTVTNLTSDSGYVDIKVTYITTEVTRRFTIIKSKQGEQGTSYTYIRYSANANGSGMVSTPNSNTKYIGIYTGSSDTVPSYTSFIWSKYVGDNGSNAIIGLLSNESCIVPADSAGTVLSFSGAVTTMYIFNGVTDDSANWSVTAGTPSGLTGYLSGKTYTVTTMSADTAYIDLTATRSGYASITKRFIITKGKQGGKGDTGASGADGTSSYTHIRYSANSNGNPMTNNPDSSTKYIGIAITTSATAPASYSAYTWSKYVGDNGTTARVYFIDSSIGNITKSVAGVLSPSSITFSSFYRDGNSTTKTSYAGRFIIQESTNNGTSWTTKYTSSTNESSKSYTPSSSSVTTIKCTLYAAGGTSSALDIITIPVIFDSNALGAMCAEQNGTVYFDGSHILAGSITALAIEAGAITSDKIATNALKSVNYVANTAGTYFNLADGSIDTKSFKVDSAGNVTATSGTVGGWIISENSIYKTAGAVTTILDNNASIKTSSTSAGNGEFIGYTVSGYMKGNFYKSDFRAPYVNGNYNNTANRWVLGYNSGTSEPNLRFFNSDDNLTFSISGHSGNIDTFGGHMNTAGGNIYTNGGEIDCKRITCERINPYKTFTSETITITPTAANVPTGKAVAWNTLNRLPDVLVTAGTSVPGTGVLGVGFGGRTTTGCTIYLTRNNTTETYVSYFASAIT